MCDPVSLYVSSSLLKSLSPDIPQPPPAPAQPRPATQSALRAERIPELPDSGLSLSDLAAPLDVFRPTDTGPLSL